MRVLFAGTPEIAVPSLQALAAQHTVVGVLTNPDRARGRGRTPEPPPVKQAAGDLGIPVFQPHTLKAESRQLLSPLKADILVVFAYGRIFGPMFLDLFPEGGVNVHPSLLPRYRGSIPIIAPIINGDPETGVTVQKIALEMDTGDILAQKRFALDSTITADQLSVYAADTGAELLLAALSDLEAGTADPVAQDPMYATYCRKLNKGDGKINWQLPNYMVERMVRGFFPWPKAFTEWNGKRLTVLEASLSSETTKGKAGTVLGIDRENRILVQTGKGVLAISRLQLQGKQPLESQAFVNGNKEIIGSQLEDN